MNYIEFNPHSVVKGVIFTLRDHTGESSVSLQYSGVGGEYRIDRQSLTVWNDFRDVSQVRTCTTVRKGNGNFVGGDKAVRGVWMGKASALCTSATQDTVLL